MIAVAILRRGLREGKTYEDFRKAWYHETGFGASNRMLTLLNVADPREVIVIALTESTSRTLASSSPSMGRRDLAARWTM